MFILVAASLTLLLCAVVIFVSRIDRGTGPRLELSPSLIFCSAFAAYALAMPFSRIVLQTNENPVDLGYMREIVVVAIAMTVGVLTAALLGQYRRLPAGQLSAQPPVVIAPFIAGLMAWSAISIYLIKWSSDSESAYDRLFAAYGIGDKAADETSVLDAVLAVVAVAANWVSFRSGLDRRRNYANVFLNRIKGFLLLSPPFVLSAFFILRGNRNMVLIQLLPLAVQCLRGRFLRVSYACLAAGVLYTSMYLVGLVRQVGFEAVTGLKVEGASFDPMKGELGTLYSVYEKVNSLGDAELLFGRSYLIDPLTNLVPQQLWPKRPPTSSQSASLEYYHESELSFGNGLGYSPIVEARVNFGSFGYPSVFILFPILLAIFERMLDQPIGIKKIYYGALAPMLINFWRIDFATAMKMSILLAVTLAVIVPLASRRYQ